jgi:hypothetical protein
MSMVRRNGWFFTLWLMGCPVPEPIDLQPEIEDGDGVDQPLVTDTDPPDLPAVIDTALEELPPPMVEPAFVLLMASFGYDANLRQAVPYVYGLGTLEPGLDIIVADDQWNGQFTETDHFCRITRNIAGSAPSSSLFDPFEQVLFGFTVPEDAPTVGDCTDRLDASVWGEFQANVDAWDWGVALELQVDADYRQQLIDAMVYTEADFDYIMGGGFAGTLFSGVSVDGYFNVSLAT